MTDIIMDTKGEPMKDEAGNFETFNSIPDYINARDEYATSLSIPKEEVYPVRKYL